MEYNYNWVDVIIVLILVVSLITGFRKGLVGALVGIVSTVVGLAVAFIYRREAADYLEQNYGMVSALTTFLEKHLTNSADISTQPGWVASLPVVNQGLAMLHQQISEIAYGLVVAICFLVLYMLSSLLVSILGLILEKILRWSILGGMNQAAGAAIILIQNILIMAALVGVLTTPLQMAARVGIKGSAALAAQMQGSLLVPWLGKIFIWLQGFMGMLF